MNRVNFGCSLCWTLYFVTLLIAPTADAFANTLGSLKQGCQNMVLALDEDNSGVTEATELLPLLNTFFPDCNSTTSLLVDVASEDVEDFCARFLSSTCITTTAQALPEPPSSSSPTPNPTAVAAPSPSPTINGITLETSTTNNRTDETLPPTEENIRPGQEAIPPTENSSDDAAESSSWCTAWLRCNKWIMIGVPIGAGLFLGICLGLVYMQTSTWQRKHSRTPPQQTEVSSFDDQLSMMPIPDDRMSKVQVVDSDGGDVESGISDDRRVVIVRSRSRSRSRPRKASPQILETLLEEDDEDSRMVAGNLSDVISQGSPNDPTVVSDALSDTTPLHRNTAPPSRPVDLDDDNSVSSAISLLDDISNEDSKLEGLKSIPTLEQGSVQQAEDVPKVDSGDVPEAAESKQVANEVQPKDVQTADDSRAVPTDLVAVPKAAESAKHEAPQEAHSSRPAALLEPKPKQPEKKKAPREQRTEKALETRDDKPSAKTQYKDNTLDPDFRSESLDL